MKRLPPPRSRVSWPRRRTAGFSIVEVTMAAVVMLLAISGSIIVMQMGFKSLDTARSTTLAAQITQSEMERIRMLSWSRVGALPAEHEIDLADIFPQNTQLERTVLAQMKRKFTAKRTVTALSEFDDEVVEIAITVTWKGLDGVTRNRSSVTRYCQNGLYAYYYTKKS